MQRGRARKRIRPVLAQRSLKPSEGGTMIRRAIPLLHVSNAAEAVKFYGHGLGFQLAFEHRPEGVTADPCYMGVTRDGVWIHLSSFSGDGVPGAVANFIVNDVDELYG